VDGKLAAETFKAWLVSNAALRKPLRWSKERFVEQANAFAAGVLGRPPFVGADGTTLMSAIPVARETAQQLGLAGVRGLTILAPGDFGGGTLSQSESEGSLAGLAAPEEEEEEEEEDPDADLKVRVNFKALAPVLKRDARRVADHIHALGQIELALLREALESSGDGGGRVEVLGFALEAAWVTVKRPLKMRPAGAALRRSGSSSGSLASTASLMSFSSSGSLTSLAESGPAGGEGLGGTLVAPAAGSVLPTAEEKQEAVRRVNAAGQALKAALEKFGGDRAQPDAAKAVEELKLAQADLRALQKQGGKKKSQK